MKRIEKVLEDRGIYYRIDGNSALVEFWTDTAGQDIPTEFDFDGTPEDFIKQFSERAENYSVDDEVELFANMRGSRGIPDSIRELLDDCQEAKDTLTEIAEALQNAIYADDMNEEQDENKYSNTARAFADAIRAFQKNPEAIDNLESYLSQHFGIWLERYANTPEGLTYELKSFSEIA